MPPSRKGPPGPPQMPRRRKKPGEAELTGSDRLVCGVVGAVFGAIVWCLVFFAILMGEAKAQARRGNYGGPKDGETTWAATWTGWGTLTIPAFAIFGAAVGPDALVEGFVKSVRSAGQAGRAARRF